MGSNTRQEKAERKRKYEERKQSGLAPTASSDGTTTRATESLTNFEDPPQLLVWIRSKLPSDVPVTNFASDWNDGVALGALVDALAPGPLSNWRHWDPEHAVQNTKSAMQLADEDLGVAQLITPEELCNPNIDEKSVMTYLAQFPQAKRAIPKDVNVNRLAQSQLVRGDQPVDEQRVKRLRGDENTSIILEQAARAVLLGKTPCKGTEDDLRRGQKEDGFVPNEAGCPNFNIFPQKHRYAVRMAGGSDGLNLPMPKPPAVIDPTRNANVDGFGDAPQEEEEVEVEEDNVEDGNGDIEEQLLSVREKRENLMKQLAELEGGNQEMEEELNSGREAFRVMQTEFSDLSERAGPLLMKHAALTKRVEEVEGKIAREEGRLSEKNEELTNLRRQRRVIKEQVRQEHRRADLPVKILRILGEAHSTPSLSCEGASVVGPLLYTSAMDGEQAESTAESLRKLDDVSSAIPVKQDDGTWRVHVVTHSIQKGYEYVNRGVQLPGGRPRLQRPPTEEPFEFKGDAGGMSLLVKFPGIFTEEMFDELMTLFCSNSHAYEEDSRSAIIVFNSMSDLQFYGEVVHGMDLNGFIVTCTQQF